jgi:hypothetical protein
MQTVSQVTDNMKIKYKDIEEAFDFVSFGFYGDHSAVLDRSTGKIYLKSESGDYHEIPKEILESDEAIEIPHKNDLGLGNQLVFEFVRSNIPDDYEHIRDIFSRRGAYARYKDFLDSKNLLQSWYDFENKAQEKTLREWCKDNGIDVIG